MAFTVITDTSGNLPKFMADEYGLKVIPFYYHVDGKDLCCEAIEDFDSETYYRRLKDGPRVTTTQITPQRYFEYFEEEAKAGCDFIYVSMSGGISGSCDSARVAVRMLEEEYPAVKAFVVDTKGAALGEGLVALEAARLRDRGLSIEEAAEKLEDYSKRMCNVFTVDDLMYLKRGGRLSNAAAWIGTILNIKPLLKGDVDGKIVAFAKLRGRRKAVDALAERYERLAEKPEEQTVGIVQAACRADAERLGEMIRNSSRPPKEILFVDYEPVTTSYVGPGALALFFLGGPDVRTALDRAALRESPAQAAAEKVRNAAEAAKAKAEAAIDDLRQSKPAEKLKNAAGRVISSLEKKREEMREEEPAETDKNLYKQEKNN